MSNDLRKTIYLNFSQRDTDDLLEIWRTHDRYEWSEQTFDAVREILQERQVELPPQCGPTCETNRPREVTTEGSNSRAGWAPIAISFVLALALDELVVAFVLRNNGVFWSWDAVIGGLFVWAVILVIGAAVGEKLIEENGSSQWKGATAAYG